MMRLWPAFKHADLRIVPVDPASFKRAEDSILVAAEAEGQNPTQTPLGFLRYTKFYGRPKAWMPDYIGSTRFQQMINPRKGREQ